MRYLSVCSGIEAATVAWHPLGWEPAAFSEIEAFPRAVLGHHYPDVPLHGDFTTIGADEYGPIDLLVGGTPCQSFSVAGLRGGMDDHRGNLALEFLKLAHRTRARWVVFENVPGLLSSNGGRDFGSFLGGLVELGYGWSYAVLDAQWFGIPQRRRRIFVVGHIGDWQRPYAVLSQLYSLQGHPPPRREKGQDAARSLRAQSQSSHREDSDNFIPVLSQGCGGETAPTLNAAFGSKLGLDNQHIDSGAGLFVAHSFRAEGFDASEDGTGRGTPLVPVAFAQNQRDEVREVPVAGALAAEPGMKQQTYIAFTAKDHGSHANGGVMPAVAIDLQGGKGKVGWAHELAHSLGADKGAHGVASGSAVRRLTPTECERLQGFPDHYTLIPYRGKPAADGPRYKALGNSMAVPVMAFIGRRIAMVEALNIERLAA